MVFIPAVNAQADNARNEALEQELEYLRNNSEILIETSHEKIIRFNTEDGYFMYGIAWRDMENPNRVYFATATEEEMESNGFFDAMSNVNSDANNISILAYSGFGNGSYAETYGNSITGGIHVYFSPDDAELAASGSVAILTIAGGAIALAAPVAGQVIGPLLVILAGCIELYYTVAKNSDDSLDINIPYVALAFMASGLPDASAFITIGTINYFFND
ncbi:hypothetical protein [Methanolapillus ohkumae]|uniref:Uncharacterized protein n=1 Tax=Methanolapillus ohkumae TaxID=3028298 RepID=A0AA96V8D1_9EURY|nr:hypothetical protein MsAm2_12950 [Methanosarcinaceae archaeon Am2]